MQKTLRTITYIRPVGQAVKTPPFHGGNMGSSPVRVTSKNLKRTQFALGFLLFGDRTGMVKKPSGSREEFCLAKRRRPAEGLRSGNGRYPISGREKTKLNMALSSSG